MSYMAWIKHRKQGYRLMKQVTFVTLLLTFTFFSIANSDRISSYPFISGDTFRAIADHIIDETNIPFDPKKVKSRDIIFLKTDLAIQFFKTLHPQIPNQYILITHNSDLSPIFLAAYDHPPKQTLEKYLNDPKLIVWFAQNIDLVHPKLKAIPIGIANNYNAHGKVEMFLNAIKNIPPFEQRFSKIYLNFTVTNNPAERKPVVDYFREKPFAYFATPKPPIHYLEEMKQYRYVINPPGNGLDCHRTWEALLLECIPIMKHSLLDPILKNLPIIFVTDWSEVTPEFLEQKFLEIKTKTYQTKKIYADYWINLIKKYQLNAGI